MSKVVDERVVEMRFDNRHFEQNVQTSLSTLDKLKQKLNLSGAAKNLDGLSNAANKVNMNGLGRAVETVTARFSALEVMGVTALANITNSAVNAGKRMVHALTVAPVGDGFKEYELTLNSVQTTMAGTGKTAEEVEAQLKKLDEYADKTVYSTADMLTNLPKFTNAGVELETATTAMIGIANATALAGGDARQASIAFYNLGQAIGTGYLTRMDYNSINNAGIATMDWKNAMVDAAIAAGTLTKVGEDAYKAGNKTLTLQQLFIDGLQEQWATTEVMLDVFGDYGDETTEIGKRAYESAQNIKTYSMMMDSLKASAGTGWKDTWQIIFGNLDEATVFWTGIYNVLSGIIEKMADFRNNLLKGALGMGFDKLQEHVSKALGPIDKIGKATKTITDPIKNVGKTVDNVTGSLEDLGAVVDKVILGDFGNGQERFDKLTKAGQNYYKVQNKVNETLGSSKRYTQEQIDAQDKLLSGQKKTTEEAQKTEKATTKLTDAQKNQLKKMVKMTEEQAKAAGYTDEQIKALNELRITAEKLGMPLDEFIDKMDEINGRWLLIKSFKNIGEAIAEVFKSMGRAFQKVFDPIKPQQLFDAIAAFHKFTSQMIMSEETAGKLQRVFQGVFAAVDLVAKVLGGGLKIAFTVLSVICEAFGTTLLDVAANVGDLIYKFNEWIEQHSFIRDFVEMLADKIPTIAEKVKEFVQALWIDSGAAENFQKIASALESIWNVVYGQFKIGLNSVIKLITAVLGLFGTNLGEIIGVVADWITTVVDWIDKNTLLTSGLSKIAEIIATVITGIANCAKAFMALKPVQDLIEKVKNAFSKLVELFDFKFDGGAIESLYNWISQIFTKIEGWINSLDTSKMFQAGLDIVAGLAEGIASGASAAIDAITNIGKRIIAAICGVLGIASPSKVMIAIGSFIILGLIQGILTGDNALAKALKSMFTNVLNTVVDFIQNGFPYAIEVVKGFIKQIGDAIMYGNIDWSALFVAATIGAAVFMMYKLLKVLENVANPLKKLGGVFGTLEDAIKDIAKAKKMEIYSRAIRNIAISLGILAASVFILAQCDWKQLLAGVIAIAAIAGVLALLVWSINKMKLTEWEGVASIASLSLFLVAMGVSLIMVAKAAEKIAGISTQGIGNCAAVLVSIGILVAAMLMVSKFALQGNAGAGMLKLAGMLIGMSVALIIMAKALDALGSLDDGVLRKGIGFVFLLSAFMAAMTLLSKGSWGADQAGSMLLKMAVAIGILVMVIKLIANIPFEDALYGIGVIGVIMLMFKALIKASYYAGEHASKAGTMFLKMAFAIGILALSMKLIATMSYSDITKGLYLIGGCELLFLAFGAVATLVGKNPYMSRAGDMFFKMGLAIGVLAIAIRLVAGLSVEDITKGIITIGAIMGLFTAVVRVSEYAGKHADRAGAMIFKMSLAILVLVGAIAILSLLKPEDVILGTACISAMLGMFALLVKMTKYAKYAQNLMKPLIVMAVCIGLLGGILITLSCLDPKGVFTATIAISAMLGMFAALLAVTKIAKTVSPSVFILVGVVAALAGVLYLIADLPISSAMGAAGALSILLLTMTAALAILSFIGPQALIGAASLAALVGVMALLTLVLKMMHNLDVVPSMETAKALTTLLLGMSAACVVLGLVGAMGPAAIVGAGVLAGVITALGAFIVGVGWLAKKIPQLEEFLDAGIPIIEKIGYALGSFFGNIIGGFASGLTSGMPDIATDLSEFMTNLQPFIDGAKSLDDGIVDNIRNLADAFLILTAADFTNKLFNGGEGTFESFGSDLEVFADSLVAFSNKAADINPDSINTAVAATEGLVNLSSKISDSVGFFEAFTGTTDMETWANGLESFAQGLVDYSNTIAEGSINSEAIVASVEAATGLVRLSTKLSDSIGMFEAFTGVTDMETWANGLQSFGNGLVGYSKVISAEGAINSEAINSSVDAAQGLVKLSGTISENVGLCEALSGVTDMATWGSNLATFGKGLVGYSKAVSGDGAINAESITNSITAATALVELSKLVGENVSWFEAFTGVTDMSTFGNGMYQFGLCLKEYGTAVADIDTGAIQGSVTAAKALTEVAKAAPKDKNLGKEDFVKFAQNAVDFAKYLADYCGELDGVDVGKINNSATATKKLVEAINATKGVDDSGVGKFKSAVDSMAQTNVKGFVSTFSGMSSQLSGVGANMINSLTSGLNAGKGKLSGAASSITSSLVKSFNSAAKQLTTSGQQMAQNLAKGLKAKASTVKSAASTVSKQSAAGAKGGYNSFYNAGYYLVQGFARGIRNSTYLATAAARYAALAAKEAINNALGINSPAKELIPSGSAIDEGLAKGIIDNLSYVKNAGVTAANYARDTISASISKIADVITMDVDSEPTIRPVVDLSDVEAGASRIGDLMNVGSSVGVLANVGRINTMMNRRNQNGVNDDVVSAIDKLRKDLGNVGGDTYSINGVTYDDGSNISNAVKDIVRAAKIGRRV